jgi:hypothetical protein
MRSDNRFKSCATKALRTASISALSSAPQWCNLVHLEKIMNTRTDRSETSNHRISVSFTADQYHYLERAAERKRVSIAWVIRDAVEKLLASDAPLFQTDDR